VRGGFAWLALGVATAALAAGCGGDDKPPPSTCSAGPRVILGALRAAPGHVTLPGGTLISTCVRRSLGMGEVQTLGYSFVAAANSEVKLIARGDDDAALRLGFLVGATRRGANETNGLQAELVRRIEQVGGVNGPSGPTAAAYRRGVAAGQDHG
jgi:hypothetical protein